MITSAYIVILRMKLELTLESRGNYRRRLSKRKVVNGPCTEFDLGGGKALRNESCSGIGRMLSRIHNLAVPTARRVHRTSSWVCGACKVHTIGTRQLSTQQPSTQQLSTQHLSLARKPFYITTPIFYVNAGQPNTIALSQPTTR